jgi:hypothetical protein
MMNILIAIAAGCAAGLMAASVVSGALISILLVYFAPLPLMVAALGWGSTSALLGGAGAGIASMAFDFRYGVAFLLTVAAPAYWLGHLSLLARPIASSSQDGQAPPLDWYPVGRLLLWTAVISVVIMTLFLLMTGSSSEEITGKLRDVLLRFQAYNRTGSSVEDNERAALMMARALPVVTVCATILMYLFNLWLAGRIARTSGSLRRPWPDLRSIELPQIVIVVLAAALLLSFVGGLTALLAQMVGAALLTIYTLVGFAVLHAVTRSSTGFWWRLAAYAVLFLFLWPLLLMPIIGLLDGSLGLRKRFGSGASPPPLSS